MMMGHGGEEDGDWNNPKLMKNVSSLSPIICVCDNSAPPSYEESNQRDSEGGQQEQDLNRSSVDSENGNPSPNSSQLYKQVSRTGQEDRRSNGSEDQCDESVVLRRDLVKQVRLLEEKKVPLIWNF